MEYRVVRCWRRWRGKELGGWRGGGVEELVKYLRGLDWWIGVERTALLALATAV